MQEPLESYQQKEEVRRHIPITSIRFSVASPYIMTIKMTVNIWIMYSYRIDPIFIAAQDLLTKFYRPPSKISQLA